MAEPVHNDASSARFCNLSKNPGKGMASEELSLELVMLTVAFVSFPVLLSCVVLKVGAVYCLPGEVTLTNLD